MAALAADATAVRGLVERVERSASRRLRSAIERMAEAARRSVPEDVVVEAIEDGIELRGRGLGARMLHDPRLRAIGLEAREWLR